MFRKTINGMRTSNETLLNGTDGGIQLNKSNSFEATFVWRFKETEGAEYNHRDLLYLLRDMCLASTDTVSTTMEWAIVELANHPEVLNRFQKEID